MPAAAAALSAVAATACSWLSQLPGPPCSARLDALSSSPFCAAVRTPPPSVAVFCVVPRSPSSPRPRPPAGESSSLPPSSSIASISPKRWCASIARRVVGDASAGEHVAEQRRGGGREQRGDEVERGGLRVRLAVRGDDVWQNLLNYRAHMHLSLSNDL